ncbi:flagellar brake protein [Chitinivorax sp. PXF-14]|uniref:flagellar brake protein n=1 Tax=Chitinivorax sp. PXF-14 TaxID=3230488 RepID=UPI0034659620
MSGDKRHTPTDPVKPISSDSPYLLRGAVDIAYVLASLVKHHSSITAFYNERQEFASVTLLAIDTKSHQLIIDPSPSATANAQLTQAGKVMCVSSHDKVKVQFDTGPFRPIQYQGRSAFTVPIPDKLLKLQRRNYYRLSIPYSQTLKCVIPIAGQMPVEVEVMDISLGGIGMIGYPLEIELEPGLTYENCSISLPGVGLIVTTLQIRSSFDFVLRTGLRTRRSGCRFLDLTPQTEQIIQRYILEQERKFRARQLSE